MRVAAVQTLDELRNGTNLVAALHLVDRMRREGRPGSVVTLLCDEGNRYLDTYYSDAWVQRRGLDLASARAGLAPLFG